MGSIPNQGTKILHATWSSKQKKKKSAYDISRPTEKGLYKEGKGPVIPLLFSVAFSQVQDIWRSKVQVQHVQNVSQNLPGEYFKFLLHLR